MSQILEFIRSLGFGGMLGAGLLGLFYFLFSNLFSQAVKFEQVLIVGSLFGAGFHGLVNQVLVQSILGPIATNIGYYSSLLQVLFLRQMGLIDEKSADKYIKKLNEKHFLSSSDGSRNTQVLLPDRKPGKKKLPNK